MKNITSVQDLKNVDVRSCLPWKNNTIKHMRAIACATFSTIDISAAGIKAAVKNDGVNHGFAKDFLQSINYWGLGVSVFSINSEMTLGMQKLYSQFKAEVDIQKYILYTKHPNSKYVLDIAKYSAETAASLAKIGTPTGFVTSVVGVYDLIKNSLHDLQVSKEERAQIEAFCAERIAVIDEYKVLMEQAVSEYFEKKLEPIFDALDSMDKAITDNDIDSYILGNYVIQERLTGKAIFKTREEFDSMMESDDPIKF